MIFKSLDMTRLPKSLEIEINQLQTEDTIQKLANYLDDLLELKNIIKNDVDVKSTIEITLINITRKF